jgi:hypothetical protein
MYPHERSLVKRLEGKPFALIGVNSDKDRDKLKSVLIEKQLTWRSFWNGGSTDGPISNQWKVRGWPSIWVIDANGVIRNRRKDLTFDMDKSVDALLAEMGVKN